MKPTGQIDGYRWRLRSVGGLAVVLFCCLTPVVRARKPLFPLETPLYTFDAASPQVQGGVVGAADVLALVSNAPAALFRGADLQMGQTGDEIDGLSGNRSLAPGQNFVVLYSMDRASIGVAGPDPGLVAAGVPYNSQDQAVKNQGASDQYLSTTLFALPIARGARSGNNTLVVNNYNEGGTEFGAVPFVAASATAAARVVAQDNVNATATRVSPAGQAMSVYFSATAASPSLSAFGGCGAVSGATILYNADPGTASTTVYACASELGGLVSGDEIDALVVVDVLGDGAFGAGDQVMFSLAPGSPSLASIPGASPEASADVFLVQFGSTPTVLATAGGLGLGSPGDNIDALEFLLCDDVVACAQDHGIRADIIPAVRGWSLLLLAAALAGAGAVVATRRRQTGSELAG